MSSLPVLHVLLLLLALHAPRAQGQPLRTQSTENYDNIIEEIMGILNESTVPPEQHTMDPNEIPVLMEGNLWLNLDAFLNATNNFKEKGMKIKANLEKFKQLLPTPTSEEKTIDINGWHDFQKKLTMYLARLKQSGWF
ncbi:PREDICTED: interleukin-3 [Hipposideros armiger]|uniref:Interleukin-3 n=1 Tax=Hipposideros armiger TaxID=186990 RepID=A0A8B7R9J1_HIPAR|nr:PREDICTED: interleukin-3 [Hipposideros armiger]